MMEDAGSVQAEASTASWPSPPVYHLSSRPRASATLDANTFVSELKGNFIRGSRWTGDASSILTTAEDRCVRVVDTLYTDGEPPSMEPTRTFQQPDAVNAALWYPLASAHAPETFCFVASVRDTPVRLLDATDGRIRATYPIVDHRERFIAPHSLAFNTTVDRLYCGFENAIEVFDVATPGYGTSDRIKTTFTRREKGGQKGLISALAFSAHKVGSFAAGSFSGSVVLYDEDTGQATGHVGDVKGGGVTQLAFHPLEENTLFVGSRRSTSIQVFDLRDPSTPVNNLERSASNNQRISFDVDPWGRWLAAGDEVSRAADGTDDLHGLVRMWDISNSEYNVVFEETLYNDTVNSVQFHPFKPLLLTSSGSRSYLRDEDLEFSSDDSSGSSSREDEPALARPKIGAKDSRLVIWDMSGDP